MSIACWICAGVVVLVLIALIMRCCSKDKN